ncbi:MAG TPA: hypothetical protein VJB65_03305, partial [Patescibacteria group bacterium]|nr:hypothetical protein [Patescibacteria group bacterium]
MGLFDKLKQVVGIGGVKVTLTVPSAIQKSALNFSGTVTLTSKSDQHIKQVTVNLEERRLKKSGGTEQILKEYTLGNVEIA